MEEEEEEEEEDEEGERSEAERELRERMSPGRSAYSGEDKPWPPCSAREGKRVGTAEPGDDSGGCTHHS